MIASNHNGSLVAPDFLNSPAVDQVGIEERIERLQKRSIKKESKVQALKLALSMIDLTTLEGADSPGKVRQMCFKAAHLADNLPDTPRVAAVCVYPTLVKIAKDALAGTAIKVAAVATGFPSGQFPLSVKLDDTRYAVNEGADEIDMVISRGQFLAGQYQFVFDEIATIKTACGLAHLKVILETGELGTLDNVRRASDLAMHAGADFIKTSTGKVQPAATLPVTLVMLEAIRDFYELTGKKIGMKPAGGIATAKVALQYLVVVRETLGQDWLTPDLFRIGASRLANDILMQLVKERTGAYQSLDYFSKD
ncbi:MAG: deoxyribose-phosphate aldolase [Anaerolineae bacterium]|nr:deoxyribose-phosphate aldolase [Phycisphaerae bacterium]